MNLNFQRIRTIGLWPRRKRTKRSSTLGTSSACTRSRSSLASAARWLFTTKVSRYSEAFLHRQDAGILTRKELVQDTHCASFFGGGFWGRYLDRLTQLKRAVEACRRYMWSTVGCRPTYTSISYGSMYRPCTSLLKTPFLPSFSVSCSKWLLAQVRQLLGEKTDNHKRKRSYRVKRSSTSAGTLLGLPRLKQGN